MNILALWTLYTESEVEVIAFLWYFLPLSSRCLFLLGGVVTRLHHHLLLLMLEILMLSMLHGLIHEVELHLIVLIVVCIRIKVRIGPLSHYLLRKADLIYLLINQLLHLQLRLS
jgi:hypothetical protein